MAADGGRVERSSRHLRDGLRKGLGRLLAHEHSGVAVDHAFQGSSLRIGNHRAAAGLRLDGHHAEILDAGHHHRVAALVQPPDVVIADPSQEFDVWAGHRAQPCFLWPASDHLERDAGQLARADRHVEPLVGHHRRHDQEVFGTPGGVGLVKVCIDRGIHDARLTIIVSADSAGNISGVGHEAVHTVGGGGVPARQARQDGAKEARPDLAYLGRSEIGIELIPRVPHRRVAVAHVPGTPRDHDRLGGAVTRADDEIESVEVELLDRGREERQILAVVASGRRQPLDERPDDPSLLECGGNRALDLEQGMNRRVRVEFRDGLQHALPAAHARQPVMDERDLHPPRTSP